MEIVRVMEKSWAPVLAAFAIANGAHDPFYSGADDYSEGRAGLTPVELEGVLRAEFEDSIEQSAYHRIMVVRDTGAFQLWGFVHYTVSGAGVKLHDLIVDRPHRGRGLGNALLDEVLRLHPHSHVACEVGVVNAAVARWLQRRGFRTVSVGLALERRE